MMKFQNIWDDKKVLKDFREKELDVYKELKL